MRKAKVLLVCLMLGLMVGCVKSTVVDPNTGKEVTTYKLDSTKVEGVENAAEAAQGIAGASGIIWPIGTAIASIIGTGLAMWRKYKPKLVAAQTAEELSYTTAETAINVIEDLKEMSPETWEKLKAKIKIGPEIENAIRAIRGLPPIV